MATRHLAVAGHYGAAHAAFSVLEGGGNAVDAGVAAGIALGVLQCDLVNVAGVAPILIYEASSGTVKSIAGLGHWPRLTDPEVFTRDHGGRIPEGILRTVVPAAPEAWITALRIFGTMSFGEVASAAIRFAGEGFPTYPLLADMIALHEADYRRWPSSSTIFLPSGRPPAVGELFVQRDLASTLQFMADEERVAAKKGRDAGLAAARDAFYRGDIARKILRYHQENDGWLGEDDLADFRTSVADATTSRFGEIDVFTCGPWCQGPVLLQALSLLESKTLRALDPQSADYVHLLSTVIDLAFADREAFYGDPEFVHVPLKMLLSDDYSASRCALIDRERAFSKMPPAGKSHSCAYSAELSPVADGPRDTSYICAVDSWGNAFSATPSDVSFDTPVIPGTGLCPSSRGSQSWTDPRHPSCAAPGKRPRLTPNPALAVKRGEWVLPFGTPGGDVQIQAMLQVFLSMVVFGNDPQTAVEAPRFGSYNFPDSFEPHSYFPGRLQIEGRFSKQLGAELSRRGHDLAWWPEWTWRAGAVCTIQADLRRGVLTAGADPRRPCYACGW